MKQMRKVLAAGVLGIGLALGAGFMMPTTAEAYYADKSSGVYEGTENGYKFYAMNVIDDDGTVYTFIYRMSLHSDDIAFRVDGDDTWHYFHFGPPRNTHFEDLALAGYHALH